MNKNKNQTLKVYTFEEANDEIFGVDTPERKEFDAYLAYEIIAPENHYRQLSASD